MRRPGELRFYGGVDLRVGVAHGEDRRTTGAVEVTAAGGIGDIAAAAVRYGRQVVGDDLAEFHKKQLARHEALIAKVGAKAITGE